MKTTLSRKLTICLLSSSVFLVPQAFAVPQDVNGPVNCDADCTSMGVDFTANDILTVADGVNIGDTNQDGTGNSVSNSVAPAGSAGQINFLGGSTISGLVTSPAPPAETLNEIRVQGTGTVAFQNDVALGGPGLLFEANGTVSIADGKNFTGNITTNTDMQGNLDFLGVSTVTGNVGSATEALQRITTHGNVVIDGTLDHKNAAIYLNGNQLDITGTAVLSGVMIEAGGDAKLQFGGVPSLLDNSTLNVGGGTLTIDNAPNSNIDITGSTINISLGGTSNGLLVFTNSSLITDNSTVVSLNVEGSIADGTVINIITDEAAKIPLPTLNGNNATYSFALNDFDGTVSTGDLSVTVSRQPLSTTALTGGASSVGVVAVGSVLDQVAISGVPSQLDPTINVIEQQTNAQVVQNTLESLSPIQDSSTNQAVTQSINNTYLVVGGRLGQLRQGPTRFFITAAQQDIYSAGDSDNRAGSWIQVFGTSIDQERRDNVAGFDGWNAGFSFGFDRQVDEDLRAGVGFSYTYTDLESKSFTKNESDIQTYQGMIYGSYQISREIYWDMIGSIGYHKVNTKRNIFIPATAGSSAVTLRADGDYNAWQYGAWSEVGYEWVWDRIFITPHINLRYSHTSYDSFTERNAGALGLDVNYSDVDELVLGGGLYLGYYIETETKAAVIPNVTVQAYHDFINDSGQSTSNFLGGGTVIATPGVEPASTSGRIGAGLDLACQDSWYLSLNYDLQFKSDYTAHGGWLRFRYEWS